MSEPCDLSNIIWGLVEVPFGAFALVAGIIAWLRPNAGIVRRFTGEIDSTLSVLRIMGPILGAFFLSVGAYGIATHFKCLSSVANWVPYFDLKVTLWWPILPFTGFAAYIAFKNSGNIRPFFREVYFLLFLAFAVSAGEAAGWHVGLQAERWFGAAMVCVALSCAVGFIGAKRPEDHQSPTEPGPTPMEPPSGS